MKLSHLHCRVRDLHAAAGWFEKVWNISPVFNNERMVWLSFGDLGVILDAAANDSIVTIGFDSKDCDADYLLLTNRGAEPIEAPHDTAWGTRTAYLKGPGSITVEIEQLSRSNAGAGIGGVGWIIQKLGAGRSELARAKEIAYRK